MSFLPNFSVKGYFSLGPLRVAGYAKQYVFLSADEKFILPSSKNIHKHLELIGALYQDGQKAEGVQDNGSYKAYELAFAYLVGSGDLFRVKRFLLKYKNMLDMKRSNYYVLLNGAAGGHLELTKYLISLESQGDEKAEKKILASIGNRAISAACENGRMEMVKYLFSKGADPFAKIDSMSGVDHAISNRYTNILNLIYQDTLAWYIASRAVQYNLIETVNHIIIQGEDDDTLCGQAEEFLNLISLKLIVAYDIPPFDEDDNEYLEISIDQHINEYGPQAIVYYDKSRGESVKMTGEFLRFACPGPKQKAEAMRLLRNMHIRRLLKRI